MVTPINKMHNKSLNNKVIKLINLMVSKTTFKIWVRQINLMQCQMLAFKIKTNIISTCPISKKLIRIIINKLI